MSYSEPKDRSLFSGRSSGLHQWAPGSAFMKSRFYAGGDQSLVHICMTSCHSDTQTQTYVGAHMQIRTYRNIEETHDKLLVLGKAGQMRDSSSSLMEYLWILLKMHAHCLLKA